MVAKVIQGTGMGIVVSIVLGVLLGVTGLGIGWLGMGLLFLLTYFTTGYVAARNMEQPYTSAVMATLLVLLINQVFTALYWGGVNPFGLALGLLAFIPSLLGAFLAHRF